MNDGRDSMFEAILLVGLLVGTLILYLYWLEVYPAPWFDEGIVLQVPRNLIRYGEYATMHPSGGLWRFDPAIQAGPTILLPIALVFHVAGVGILQARLVMAFYSLLALLVFYLLVRGMSGAKVALLASLLLVFGFDHEFTSFVFMGRQVLAEVPALGFFWLGTLLWFRAWKRPRWVALVWPGLFWGLAMLTKVQFTLILPVALILFWLFDHSISGKKLPIHSVLVPALVSGGCVLMWYGYQAFSLGFGDFWQQARELEAAGGIHFLSFSPRKVISAGLQLSGSPLALFGVPGMLYTLCLGLQKRGKGENRWVFLAMFTATWLGWYAFLSIAWMRYAFVPAAMSAMLSARLLDDLWNWTSERSQTLSRRLPVTAGQVAVGGVIVTLLLSGLLPMTKRIVQSPDSGLQELADYLNTYVPTDALIESWEYEVDLLTDHTYHHPPYEVTNAITAQIWYGTPASPDIYDPLVFHPAYLIRGSFARWTGIYPQELLEQRCMLIQSAGEYELYEVKRGEEK
jgi:4-amino-4-deoxy-L-arabinose transferase-like glycosyltransferase